MKISMKMIKAAKRIILHDFSYLCLKLLPSSTSKLNAKNAVELLYNTYPKPASNAYTHNNIFEPKHDLTVIVPAYNTEKYIEQCLNSIVSQKTRYSFKIIVINDGSTDSTGYLLNKYKLFPQIDIIYQKNKGLSGARNTAIKDIYSRYLMFVDSDDVLEKDAINVLLSNAFEFDADVVEGSYYRFLGSAKILEHSHEDKKLVSPVDTMSGYSCGKVFRSSLFRHVQFPECYWFQDTIVKYLLFSLCKKALTIEAIVSGYRENSDGITATARKSVKCLDTYYITELMFEDMKLLGIAKNQSIYEQTLRQISLNFSRTRNMSRNVRESIFVLSASLLKKEFPKYRTTVASKKKLEYALLKNNYSLYNYILDS